SLSTRVTSCVCIFASIQSRLHAPSLRAQRQPRDGGSGLGWKRGVVVLLDVNAPLELYIAPLFPPGDNSLGAASDGGGRPCGEILERLTPCLLRPLLLLHGQALQCAADYLGLGAAWSWPPSRR